jgi:hypothetical protein
VTLFGTGFGPLGTTITARYSSANLSLAFNATGCAVTTAHTAVRCDTVAGVGSGFTWEVTVGGQTSLPATSVTSSYSSPVITGLRAGAGSDALTSMPTTGGTVVVVEGREFGAAGLYPVTGVGRRK